MKLKESGDVQYTTDVIEYITSVEDHISEVADYVTDVAEQIMGADYITVIKASNTRNVDNCSFIQHINGLQIKSHTPMR